MALEDIEVNHETLNEQSYLSLVVNAIEFYNQQLKRTDLTLDEANKIVTQLGEARSLQILLKQSVIDQDSSQITQLKIDINTLLSIIQNKLVGGEFVGPQGPKGDQGLKGDTGPQGPKGDQGFKGDTGAKGDQGVQGLKGDKGDTGAKGDQGLKGDDGVMTFEDLTLSQKETLKGERGIQGLKGDKGAKGDQGLKGDTGLKVLKVTKVFKA